jgi:pilus assembly protein Flp/PilA
VTCSYPRTQFVKNLISRFEKDGSGVTAVEYALIAASIGGAIMAVVVGLGSDLQKPFSDVSSAMGASSDQASSDQTSSDQTSSDKDSSDTDHRRDGDRRSWDRGSFDHDHFHR